MIRAEELMLGDYLTFPDVQNDSNCPKLRVVAINEVDVYVSVDGDPEADLCDPKELAGIPLTPEILEKNFGSALHGCYFEGDEFYELMIHEVNDGTWIIRHDNIEFSNIPRQQVMAGFVHEFQRALRCFGLFDLANNIKI